MIIYYCDELNKLDDEIKQLMEACADKALETEFAEAMKEWDYTLADLPIAISMSVVEADEIRTLNRDFRGIDKTTDVLSFPQYADSDELLDELSSFELEDSDDPSEETTLQFDPAEVDSAADMNALLDDEDCVLIGDVVICYDKAVEQAEEYGTGIKRELVYLFVHSVFHLLGYDHMEDEERKVMRAREEAVLASLGISR